VTGAADVYSLGCVVFECLNGSPPYAAHQGMRVLWAHLQEEPPDPCPDRPEIPEAFREAVKTALRKEPAERPATSVEYAASLVRAAGTASGDGTS
jgi:serine/threonine protein kinase